MVADLCDHAGTNRQRHRRGDQQRVTAATVTTVPHFAATNAGAQASLDRLNGAASTLPTSTSRITAANASG